MRAPGLAEERRRALARGTGTGTMVEKGWGGQHKIWEKKWRGAGLLPAHGEIRVHTDLEVHTCLRLFQNDPFFEIEAVMLASKDEHPRRVSGYRRPNPWGFRMLFHQAGRRDKKT